MLAHRYFDYDLVVKQSNFSQESDSDQQQKPQLPSVRADEFASPIPAEEDLMLAEVVRNAWSRPEPGVRSWE